MTAHEQNSDTEVVSGSAGEKVAEKATENEPTTAGASKPPGKSVAQRALELRAPIINLVAGIVRWVGVVFAVILVVHIILYIGQANQDSGITQFFASFADTIAIGFKNLFMPADVKLQVLINYGVAAIFWLVVTSIVARILKRFS